MSLISLHMFMEGVRERSDKSEYKMVKWRKKEKSLMLYQFYEYECSVNANFFQHSSALKVS